MQDKLFVLGKTCECGELLYHCVTCDIPVCSGDVCSLTGEQEMHGELCCNCVGYLNEERNNLPRGFHFD